ncbi:type II-A CRISPR-associated protein Csn2 [Ligilactobacillus pobuzihii]|uniref:type II-A CRISPR-associated protein Csn2 n=1 Tax=Ligilactobacillus pobuzihii TaxID=449659 RepID=UPI0019CFE3F1|nr:type II-A CRISPR-associated protein Csn2 [Ligilactobacillus pobuzihii]MBN7274377.1 type II-A CRISPR-associated protein Csn2 [Ligilactobacillus pobuzihii]
MKFSYSTHKPFKIESGRINVIATDNQVVYKDLILGLKDQNELLKVFNDDLDLVEISKAFDWLGDLMIQKDINKRYMPEIVKKLFSSMPAQQRNRIHEATTNLDNAIQESLYLANLPVKVTYDFDLKKAMKFTDAHINQKILDDPCDIIKTVIRIHEMCDLKSCLAICNVAHYILTDQIKELSEFLQDVNQSILLIEFTDMSQSNFYSDCNFYYIDKDFVDWY